jgi:hypothetical protein
MYQKRLGDMLLEVILELIQVVNFMPKERTSLVKLLQLVAILAEFRLLRTMVLKELIGH